MSQTVTNGLTNIVKFTFYIKKISKKIPFQNHYCTDGSKFWDAPPTGVFLDSFGQRPVQSTTVRKFVPTWRTTSVIYCGPIEHRYIKFWKTPKTCSEDQDLWPFHGPGTESYYDGHLNSFLEFANRVVKKVGTSNTVS